MENQQINLTPLEVATIYDELHTLAGDGKLQDVEHVRICADKANLISIYSSDGLLFTVNRKPNE